MATDNTQETLDRLLRDLKSGDPERCLSTLQELDNLNYSSPAILSELEKIALRHADETVRSRARQSLGTSIHKFIRSKRNQLARRDRTLVLEQIEQWELDGLLDMHTADVIKARYNFDETPQPAARKPVPEKEEPVAPKAAPPHPIPSIPRPTLTETLLSEASIKIYLYLGAFFVIASALILAAVVEAARLPILTGATLAFGGAAFILRKRLPQPSFALFIVFSFLLPIDANVVEETIGFTEPALSIYWTINFFLMAVIWGFSVWFYESRFFSAVAFVALSLSFYRGAHIINTDLEWKIFMGMLASLAGLAGTLALTNWKSWEFSRPVFLLSQLQVAGLLLISIGLNLNYSMGLRFPDGGWILTALAWLAAASFYALSDLLRPGLHFPWLAAMALLPLPGFVLNAFDASQPVYAFGFWLWGTAFALASEAVYRHPIDKAKSYTWPLLAGSVPLFLISFAFGLVRGQPSLLFMVFGLTAIVYAGLHWVRPRAYIWSAALLSGLLAYFTFFQLPSIVPFDIPVLYQVLIATLVLVVPELFAKTHLTLSSQTRLPTITLGAFLLLLGITLSLFDLENPGRAAINLIAYAVLFTLHGLHSERQWLGYFAAALESLAVIYALDHFNLDLWLPALTLLSVLYYGAGFFFRRMKEMKAWGTVLVNSGLALGILLSIASLVLLKETSGWYLVLIAALFAVELFARPLVWLELAVEALLSIALFLILDDFNIPQPGHFLFGASLLWLGGDWIFGRLIQGKRHHQPITLSAGFILVFMASLVLWEDANPDVAAIYFSLYALFFSFYAAVQRQPGLGYFATGFLSLAVIQFCDLLDFEQWIFPWIGLAVLYYLSGFFMRQTQDSAGWDRTLLQSGLVLGVMTAFAAPFLGGLESSIPVAIAATLFAAEAFARRNVWWALPANALYLMSYFMILVELDVDEPQYYSIGAALLGMLMHYLLTRAGSKTGAFAAGMLSQLVLLGTTYIQMVSTERLLFFFVLFVQSMVVLVYGLIQRSRSLVITPIAFAVVGVMTVAYSALKGLGPVILIGSTGLLLLMAGIVAVLMRERITKLGEQLSDWKP